MRIRTVSFRASGGFAGLVRGADMNGEELSAGERSALELRCAGEVPFATEARDLTTYELAIETDEGLRRVAFDELSTPDHLAALVRRLERRSRPVQL